MKIIKSLLLIILPVVILGLMTSLYYYKNYPDFINNQVLKWQYLLKFEVLSRTGTIVDFKNFSKSNTFAEGGYKPVVLLSVIEKNAENATTYLFDENELLNLRVFGENGENLAIYNLKIGDKVKIKMSKYFSEIRLLK